MKNDIYFVQCRAYFGQLIADYFESGYFESFVAKTAAMISPYMEKDPIAFCSYEEYLLAVDAITEFCLLRAQSVRGQLEGIIPATIRGQMEDRSGFVDASGIWLPDMGKIADLKD